jgi:hypothetical protein
MILLLGLMMLLVSCMPLDTKPLVYQCTKVWNKQDQRAVYDCIDAKHSTLDGPR